MILECTSLKCTFVIYNTQCTRGQSPCALITSAQFRYALLLFVIPYLDVVPRCAEGVPRDVEPAGGGEQLVGVVAGAEIVDKALKLAGVLGANVGSLTKQMLRVLDATDEGIDARVAVAGVDEDGADQLASGLQEQQAAIGHVRHVLHGGLVVGVLAQIEELAKFEVGREPSVIDCCVHRGTVPVPLLLQIQPSKLIRIIISTSRNSFCTSV